MKKDILVVTPWGPDDRCTVAGSCGGVADWTLGWPKTTRRACDAHMAAAVRNAFVRYDMLVKVRREARV